MNPVQTVRQKTYKWCIVPMCTNTSCTTPKKLFIHVPKDPQTRKKWMLASRRNAGDISEKSTVYCCEDHFNLENDMENWVKFGIMGGPMKIKSGVIPHKFECQSDVVHPMDGITIKEEVIWPMEEEENNEGEASTEDGHNSSLPFEEILIKTEPIKVEAVENMQDIEDELHSREDHSDGAITEKKDYQKCSKTVGKYKRRTDRKLVFTTEIMEEARRRIADGESKRQVAATLGINESTLRKRLKMGSVPTSLGRFKRIFTDEMEQELAAHCRELELQCYGISRKQLMEVAFSYAEMNNVHHSFNKEKRLAGKDWVVGFCKRQGLSLHSSSIKSSLGRAIKFSRVQRLIK